MPNHNTFLSLCLPSETNEALSSIAEKLRAKICTDEEIQGDFDMMDKKELFGENTISNLTPC